MATALVITTAGINCDRELAGAFESAGATTASLHLKEVIADPGRLEEFDLIGLPGGFSYGDAIAAGRIEAQLVRLHLYRALVGAIERGVPIIAPCNGFQMAVQAGLLPGPESGTPWPDEPPAPVAALTPNVAGRFADRWTRMEVPASRCVWTRGVAGSLPEEGSVLPSAHGEGRFVAPRGLLDALDRRGQIALRYGEEDNFNGSMDRIAGICDASGLLLGLMPHPERFTRWTQHPYWTRLPRAVREGSTPFGLAMFRNAVAFVTEGARVGG